MLKVGSNLVCKVSNMDDDNICHQIKVVEYKVLRINKLKKLKSHG